MQTSRTNNKQVMGTFKFDCPRLTLKEGPKVKSDHTRRFLAHDFIQVGFTLQTSRTNNKRNNHGGHLVFQNEAKKIPRQDFMVMNISCKFQKISYNIFFIRVMVKSLYTLWRQHNETKSIVSTGCYLVDITITSNRTQTSTRRLLIIQD